MSEPSAETALETIRALELERARQIEDERASAEKAVTRARHDARRAVRAARDRGIKRAEWSHDEKVADAIAEAERIKIEAAARVEELLTIIRPRFGELIDEMVDTVLTTQTEDRGRTEEDQR